MIPVFGIAGVVHKCAGEVQLFPQFQVQPEADCTIKIALRMLVQGIDRDLVLAATQLSEADLAANNH